LLQEGLPGVSDGFAVFLRKFHASALNNMGNGIDVVAKGAASQPGSLQGYGASPGKGIKYPGHMVEVVFDGFF